MTNAKPVFTIKFSSSSDDEEEDESSEPQVQLKPKQQQEQKNESFREPDEYSSEFNKEFYVDDDEEEEKKEIKPKGSVISPPQSPTSPRSMRKFNIIPEFTYSCIRGKEKLGTVRTFDFLNRRQTILYARSNGIPLKEVAISATPNVDIKNNKYQHLLNVKKNKTHFILNAQGNTEVLMDLVFTNDYGNNELGPRILDVKLPNEGFHSRIPVKAASGGWKLPFNGMFVLKSQKNCILLDSNEYPVIIIKKIQKQILEINTQKPYDEAFLFALAISSWICEY